MIQIWDSLVQQNIIRQILILKVNMKIQCMNKSMNKIHPHYDYKNKYEPARNSLQNSAAIYKTTTESQNYRKSNRQPTSSLNYGLTGDRKSWSSIYDDKLSNFDHNAHHMEPCTFVKLDEGKKIFRFSDFKKSPNNNKSCNKDDKMVPNIRHTCQNHPKRLSKFFILTNTPHNSSADNIHYYCINCSINLSKMNFNVCQIPQAVNWDQPVEIAIAKLIGYKNLLNTRAEQLKNEGNLEYIETKIQGIEDKYQHIVQLLEKIKKEQIQSLENLRLRLIQFINQEEIKLASVCNKVEYYIGEFGNMLRSGEIKIIKQKTPKKMHKQSIEKLKKQTQNLNKIDAIYTLQLPKELTFLQITKKLQNLFTETVHSLSFELESKKQQSENSQKFHNESLSEPEIKLRKYLYNKDKTKVSNKFNETFGCQVVEGINFVLSESGSFFDQENAMINI